MRNTALIILGLFIFIQLTQSTIIPYIGKLKGAHPPKFRMDLNDEPRKRWAHIAPYFTTQLHEVLALANVAIDKFMPNQGRTFFAWVELYALTKFKYQEIVEEVKGIAEVTHMPFAKLFVIQLIYEITTVKACSSILVRNSTGHVMHGRNMDFEFWNRFSRLTAEIDVYRGDKYVYTLDALVGTVFALTGSKKGKFSLTEDTRFNDRSFMDVLKDLILKDYMPSAWLLRKTLEEEETFASAAERLKTTNISAPIYYILSGINPNEGIVIERQSVGVHASYQLNDTTWYLVQTNYDRDQPDEWYDSRRTPVEKRLNEMGNNFDIQTMFDKINSKWPTMNIASIITMMAVSSSGYHNFTAWYGVLPQPKDNTTSIDTQIEAF